MNKRFLHSAASGEDIHPLGTPPSAASRAAPPPAGASRSPVRQEELNPEPQRAGGDTEEQFNIIGIPIDNQGNLLIDIFKRYNNSLFFFSFFADVIFWGEKRLENKYKKNISVLI